MNAFWPLFLGALAGSSVTVLFVVLAPKAYNAFIVWYDRCEWYPFGNQWGAPTKKCWRPGMKGSLLCRRHSALHDARWEAQQSVKYREGPRQLHWWLVDMEARKVAVTRHPE